MQGAIFLLKGLALFKRQQNLYLIARLDPACVTPTVGQAGAWRSRAGEVEIYWKAGSNRFHVEPFPHQEAAGE
ncbi:MAG: hypothetical protein ACRESZ_18030, partial [Methylococcales bacterium]